MSTAKKSNPGLWKRIVARVKAGTKGGDPGEWSGRKAQLAVQQYKKSGGGYSGPKKETSLSKWTKQEWTTSDGKPSEGKKRYLPKAAWAALSAAEKAATNRAKAQGNKSGKQFVNQPEKIASKVKPFRKMQNGGAVAEPEVDFHRMLDYVQAQKGGKRRQYVELQNAIAYHETGPQQRMKLAAQQLVERNGQVVPGGPGKGLFMFESGPDGGAVTAVRRTYNYFKANNIAIPQWLADAHQQNDIDASKLNENQQRMLFLGNYMEHPKANFTNYLTGKESAEDFWFRYHQAGGPDVEAARRAAWRASQDSRTKERAAKAKQNNN